MVPMGKRAKVKSLTWHIYIGSRIVTEMHPFRYCSLWSFKSEALLLTSDDSFLNKQNLRIYIEDLKKQI